MKRILYVDVPFQGLMGGDKNRSSFIWNTLSKACKADLLLIKIPEYAYKPVPQHSGYNAVYTIATRHPYIYQSESIYMFSKAQQQKFVEILNSNRYEKIVFRFLSCYHLANLAGKTFPATDIYIDVDMLFSRISELVWQNNKTIHNRYHFVEMIKLKAFEKKAFQSNFTFFFTNSTERDLAIERYCLNKDRAVVFPNMMPKLEQKPLPEATLKTPEIRYILFFGTLNSVANQDAFLFLAEEIYPLIAQKLQDENIYIYIVGKNPLSMYDKYCATKAETTNIENKNRMILMGAVDDIRRMIAHALFVILPLRIASGTRTRILEAAAERKAVISTTIGAEGFDFATDELTIKDDAIGFAKAMEELITNNSLAIEMGDKLYDKSVSLYAPSVVAESFLQNLQTKHASPEPHDAQAQQKRLKIAIITNRFYPEVGGAETNIFYQARLLAEEHDVTVICPKRINRSNREVTQGFTILRLWDLLNIGSKYPNLKAKTLCPQIVLHLLKTEYDIIQCFPALNYNNLLAFVVAKLKSVPFIICFFDFIDYAGIISSKGKIDPNILATVKPKFYQRFVLKYMDYAFAIAEKEISFLKQFNPRVKYSPVPILTDEYALPVANPRSKLGLKEDDFVFLCLGRVSYIKGQDIALKAFAEVYKEIPGAKLVFVGRTGYEQQFFGNLQSFIAEFPDKALQESVFWTGMVERNEVLGWLKYADIHLIPVRFMNSGAVVVESWVSGTPVIQSDVVDPCLVTEGENGYLFESENAFSCANKMRECYRNRSSLKTMAEKGNTLVQSKYTYQYLIELYNQTYRELLS
ncbi:MAG: glycosyltransferase [Candidatus Cloacimonetes bacterium]|nr:glycosyltransferase [Candidatus Cloacimonadota bacterium]